jgi:hypothetical protein
MRGGYAARKRSNRAKNACLVRQRPANFGTHEYIACPKRTASCEPRASLTVPCAQSERMLGWPTCGIFRIAKERMRRRPLATARGRGSQCLTADVQCTVVHITGGGLITSGEIFLTLSYTLLAIGTCTEQSTPGSADNARVWAALPIGVYSGPPSAPAYRQIGDRENARI